MENLWIWPLITYGMIRFDQLIVYLYVRNTYAEKQQDTQMIRFANLCIPQT